jgi:ribosomal protein S25
MAGKGSGGSRRPRGADALKAGREHLQGSGGAVDNGATAGQETAEDQGGTGEGGVDKDVGRVPFTLSEDQREQLRAARERDESDRDVVGGDEAPDHELRFWSEVAPQLGANAVTVETADDVLESGAFTAWPAESEEAFDPATNEQDHQAALSRFEQLIESGQINIGTIGGDLRDIMLDIFRNRHKPWGALSKDEQHDVATAIDFAVKVVLRRVVAMIAADARPSISAQLVSHTNKGEGEIEGKIKMVGADDSAILALAHATGKTIMIVMADADPYLGQRRPPAIEEDQRALEFEAGSDGPTDPPPPADSSDLADAGDAVVDEEALFQKAVELVRESQEVGVSYLQRKLSIAYSVATAIVERMEREDMISAPDATTKRKVLIEPAAPAAEEQAEAAE